MTKFEYEVYTDETETETTIRTVEISSVEDAVDAIEGDPDAVYLSRPTMPKNIEVYDSYAEGHMGDLPENTDELDTIIQSVNKYFVCQVSSYEDYGRQVADEYNIPEGLSEFIDYDGLGRAALEDYLDYDGFYFENH